LEASSNPFAKIVLAHLKTLQTRQNPRERRDWKFRIACGLHECGFSPGDTQQLMKLVDWLMELPAALQRNLDQRLHQFEEGRRVPYVTSWERHGMLLVIERTLRTKFGEAGAGLVPKIEELNDADKYLAIHDVILQANDLDEVRRACAEASPPTHRRKKGSNGKRGRTRT